MPRITHAQYAELENRLKQKEAEIMEIAAQHLKDIEDIREKLIAVEKSMKETQANHEKEIQTLQASLHDAEEVLAKERIAHADTRLIADHAEHDAERRVREFQERMEALSFNFSTFVVGTASALFAALWWSRCDAGDEL